MSDPTSTTCLRCAVGCGLRRSREDGAHTVRGDVSHPVSHGAACRRGLEETAGTVAGERVTEPLVRVGDDLEPTTWAKALEVVTDRFTDTLEADRNGVAVLGSGQQTNEAAYALGKLARGGFGTRHYDANTTLCMASAVTAYYDAFGSDAPPPTYDDIPDAKSHVVWGANPAVAHPVLHRWIVSSARESGSQLLVVDPVVTETADDADVHVRPTPGTDLALARAVLARVLETGRIDREFVENDTTGFDRLVERLPDVAAGAETAGVSLEVVDALARALERETLLYWGMGVNQHVQGTATAGALIDLCLATGNLGPGSGPFSLTGQANSMGTRVCASKGTWPGHRPFDDPAHRAVVAESWDVPLEDLPDDPGPGPVGIVDAIAAGDIEACWTVATNPAVGMPDATRVRDALEDVFLVVQDAFHTETTELADVVLPAATWGETEGTVTNMERRVSRVRAVAEPSGSARTDLEIIAAVGGELEPGLLEDSPDPESVFAEIRELTAGTPADHSGISYDRLEAERAVRWPAPDATEEGGYRYEENGSWRFPTESGQARFSGGRHGGLAEPPDEAYPLILTTARRPDAYNTGVRNRRRGAADLPVARINPDTVEEYLRGDWSRAVVGSRRGSTPVRVEPDDAVPPNVVWLGIHHPVANELTLPEVDPHSAEPSFKQCAVSLFCPRVFPLRMSLRARGASR
ncbi:assimilatory nitrate reductase NasA [Natrialbaceae archaeon A-gly3]